MFHSRMRSGLSLDKMSLQVRNPVQVETVNMQTV